MESFWEHSIACGLFSIELTFYKSNHDPEKFFVAGMLHDIGNIVLCTKLPLLSMNFYWSCNLSPSKLIFQKKRNWGLTMLTWVPAFEKKWNLSNFHMEMVAFHHKPNHSPYFAFEASILHFSDDFANTMQLGSSGEKSVYPKLEEEVWESLRIFYKISLFDLRKKIYDT